MEFTFPSKAKMFSFALMALGAIGIGVGAATGGGDHHFMDRLFSNMYINGFFFFAISLGALFFLWLQYATEAAWGTVLKRMFEGVMAFLPYGAVVLLIVLVAGEVHVHHMFHWMDPEVYDPASAHYDHIIAGKAPYLGAGFGGGWFFWLRTVIYLAVFMYFWRLAYSRSAQEDKLGGTEIHFKNYRNSGWFLVFFAVFSTTFSWDWLMSIDTHWFSTLYGWYVFSGMWVSAIICILVTTLYLKKKGYLQQVNENHIHDLGKWMFAISILWSYLWFSQFMLIWYADIPEEVTYFVERFEHYKVLYLGMFFVNLILPLVILMSRDAKRNYKFLIVIALIIFFGHWVDTFLLITPGVMHEHWHFSFLEFGFLLLFTGAFIFVVMSKLTKSPLVPVNHPYLEESINHHI